MTPAAAKKATAVCRTLGSTVEEVRRELRGAGIESAEQESAWLLEHVVGLSPLQQAVDHHRVLSAGELDQVHQIITRRLAREPLQYILGTQEFCGLEFQVNPSVLIPRPETELLPQIIARRHTAADALLIVDVGTGSGCLAVVLARLFPRGRVWAIDVSSSAIETAKRNAGRHGVASAITWLQGDLFAPLADHGLEQKIAVIVSNPPYISEADWPALQPEVRLYEPRTALLAGPRGTEFHERLLEQAVPFLAPGGILVIELGQGQSLSLLERVRPSSAYQSVDLVCDEAGIERVLIAERSRT